MYFEDVDNPIILTELYDLTDCLHLHNMRYVFFSILLFFFTSNLEAQNQDLCKEGDCPKEVMSIKLDAPLDADPTGMKQRTEQFKTAYLAFKSIKDKQITVPGWKQKYKDWGLTGTSCVRFYQLEGRFSHEYLQNPSFKAFIDQQESDIRAFKKEGFESSRRAINLLTRMKGKCKKQVKKLEESAGPSTADLPPVYRKIGEDLGYFDKDGNLKLPDPNEEKAAQLSQKLAQIPIGGASPQQLAQITNGLTAGQNAMNALTGAQSQINFGLSGLLPKPQGLLSKVGKLRKAQNALSTSLNNKPNATGLLGKLNQLINKGNDLKKKVESVADQASKLKKIADQVDTKIGDSKKQLENQQGNANDLKNTLSNLLKKKTDLTEMLKDPGKNLDELEKQVNDLLKQSSDAGNQLQNGAKKQEDLVSELTQLTKDQNDILPQLRELEEKLKTLENEQNQLENETQKVSDEAAKPDPNQEAIAKLQDHLKSLNLEPEWKKELGDCENGVKNLLKKINPFPKIQLGLKNKVAGFLSGPSNILSKLSGLKKVHDNLKTQAQGLTNNKDALKKVDQLIATYTSLKAKAEQASGEKDKLSNELTQVEKTLKELTQGLNGDLLDIASLQQEVDSLLQEKSNLFTRLSKPIEVVRNIENKVNNFTERYGIFGKKKKCKDKSDEEAKAEDLSQKQASLQEQIDELEKKIESLKKEQEDLAEETKQLAEEIETKAQNELALKDQEQALKEEFGTDVSLDPVPVEEWAESFEVKRPYWDAVFHPDDEVVDGMVGRYFEVKLKDAEKNVKLLFGPGKYFMEKNEFRSNYGSTIGAFVTEALHYMKKGDENKVRLFVQGSADIAGHKTFRGKLDDRYLYEEVAVLSQNADKESFSSIAVEKNIPKTNFDNTHLPDLRGNYLKEMIGKYSKKLKPTLLEGEVKKFEGVGERNAVIYLFFPEELLSEYEE